MAIQIAPPTGVVDPVNDDFPTDPDDFERDEPYNLEPADLRWIGSGLLAVLVLMFTALYAGLKLMGL